MVYTMMQNLQANIALEDLRYIIDNPWSISEVEWRLGDENNKNAMFSYIQELLVKTEDEGYSKIWKTESKEPIAILGGYKVGHKKYTTFLICSHHYDKHVMKLSFDMRSTLKELSAHFKGYTIGIHSVSPHPSLFTWLRFLGFTHVPEEDRGDWRYFELTTPTN